jgi:hypothetical protein
MRSQRPASFKGNNSGGIELRRPEFLPALRIGSSAASCSRGRTGRTSRSPRWGERGQAVALTLAPPTEAHWSGSQIAVPQIVACHCGGCNLDRLVSFPFALRFVFPHVNDSPESLHGRVEALILLHQFTGLILASLDENSAEMVCGKCAKFLPSDKPRPTGSEAVRCHPIAPTSY